MNRAKNGSHKAPKNPEGCRIVGQCGKATLVRVTPDGIVRRFIRHVQLTQEKGHFYEGFAPGQGSKPKIITAQGFYYLNSFAPLAFIPTPTIFNNEGKEVGNPERSQDKSLVRVRRFAVGRTSDGTLRAYDLTVNYDVFTYFAADVLNKYNDRSNNQNRSSKLPSPEWGKIINDRNLDRFLNENPSWGSVPLGPGTSLAYDATNDVIRKLYREHMQRMMFADRFANTICERNILKKHFGFSTVPKGGVVQVACWEQPEFSTGFEDMQKSVITRNGKIIVDGEEIQVEVSEQLADQEDMEAVGNDEADATESGLVGRQDDPTPQQQQSGPTPEKLRSDLSVVLRAIGGKKQAETLLKEPLKEIGFKGLGDVATCEDTEKLSKIYEICRQFKSDQASKSKK